MFLGTSRLIALQRNVQICKWCGGSISFVALKLPLSKISRFQLQVGLSRSTTGCVSACLFREFQLHASFEGLIETVPGVNLELLRMDNYEVDLTKDTLFRGEFEVVKELCAALGKDGDVST